MRRGLQESFDITKLVGVLALAAFSTVALAGIEDGSDPTGPLGIKGQRIERGATTQSIANVDPIGAGTADDCTQQQCDATCAFWFPPPCTITYSACFTNPEVGHAQCSCAKVCPGGTVAPSKYKTCAVQQDSSDGR
jgi:hypothetical protein